jgi:uncharacterized LabA/DUF88 family protein
MIQEWIRHAAEAQPKGGVALLIDAAQFRGTDLDRMMEIATRHGNVAIRRLYGTPRHVAPYEADPRFARITTETHGATTVRMAIDALDLAHQGNASVFVLASPNSDMATLATRLRELGNAVVGIGPARSPEALQDACCAFHRLG